MKNNVSRKYIPLTKAAKIYRCTPEHLNLMSRQGKLNAVKLGRNWFTTKKWLKEYKNFVEIKEGKRRHLISNIKTIYPFQIKQQIRNLFKKTLIISLASLIISLSIGTIYVDAKSLASIFDISSVPSAVENYLRDVETAYSETFKLAKAPIGALAFSYTDFIDSSLKKISKQSEKGFDKLANFVEGVTDNFGVKVEKNNESSFTFDFGDISKTIDNSIASIKSIKYNNLLKVEIKLAKREKKPEIIKSENYSFLDFFSESLFNSFNITINTAVNKTNNSFASVIYSLDSMAKLFDFSEELGDIAEKINKPFAVIVDLYK